MKIDRAEPPLHEPAHIEQGLVCFADGAQHVLFEQECKILDIANCVPMVARGLIAVLEIDAGPQHRNHGGAEDEARLADDPRKAALYEQRLFHWPGLRAVLIRYALLKQPSVKERVTGAELELLDCAKSGHVAAQTNADGSARVTAMRNLRADAARLWDDLMGTAAIGGTAKGGICRLTLTDLDREVRDWFRKAAESVGCTVTVDDMGVMFARREGQRSRHATHRHRQSLGHATHRRQIRRQPRGAGGAGGGAHAARCRLYNLRTDRGRELDQRGGLALHAGDAGLGRVRRRVHARLGLQPDRPRRREVRRRAGGHRPARRRRPVAITRCRRSSSCISSRGRFWRRKASTSAPSRACRASAGSR